MKLGGSLGNVLQKLKNLVINLYCINFTLENGLAVRNVSSFYKVFFFLIFVKRLPSDPSNFI
jgi:hypothetical protein